MRAVGAGRLDDNVAERRREYLLAYKASLAVGAACFGYGVRKLVGHLDAADRAVSLFGAGGRNFGMPERVGKDGTASGASFTLGTACGQNVMSESFGYGL